jgi:YesN/AraC family two-component response regulator
MCSKTILLLDDELFVLNALKRVLRSEPYQVIVAQNASDAFRLLSSNLVHLVISDQRMPEMSGLDFLKEVKVLYPQVVRLIISGYSESEAMTEALDKGEVYRFIPKPWEEEQIKEAVLDALAFHQDQFLMFQTSKGLQHPDALWQSATGEDSFFQQILNKLPQLVLITNPKGKVIFSNQDRGWDAEVLQQFQDAPEQFEKRPLYRFQNESGYHVYLCKTNDFQLHSLLSEPADHAKHFELINAISD